MKDKFTLYHIWLLPLFQGSVSRLQHENFLIWRGVVNSTSNKVNMWSCEVSLWNETMQPSNQGCMPEGSYNQVTSKSIRGKSFIDSILRDTEFVFPISASNKLAETLEKTSFCLLESSQHWTLYVLALPFRTPDIKQRHLCHGSSSAFGYFLFVDIPMPIRTQSWSKLLAFSASCFPVFSIHSVIRGRWHMKLHTSL